MEDQSDKPEKLPGQKINTQGLRFIMSPVIISPEKKEQKHNPNAVPVFQRGFSVIDKKAPIKEICTFGLGPCIAVVLYHPDEHVLIVAHFDTMTKVEDSFATLADWLKGGGVNDEKFSELQVSMIGGDITSEGLQAEMDKTVKEWRFGKEIQRITSDSNQGGSLGFVVSVDDGRIRMDEIPARPEDPLLRQAKMMPQLPVYSALSPEYISINGKTQGLE